MTSAGRAPDWSPDGAAIAYASGDGGTDVSNIFVLDLATGETSQVTNEKPTPSVLAVPRSVPPSPVLAGRRVHRLRRSIAATL